MAHLLFDLKIKIEEKYNSKCLLKQSWILFKGIIMDSLLKIYGVAMTQYMGLP